MLKSLDLVFKCCIFVSMGAPKLMEGIETKIFKLNSYPIKEVKTVFDNEIIYTSIGDCYICKLINSIYEFHKIHNSVLIPGESIERLNKNETKLFWSLSRYERRKMGISK